MLENIEIVLVNTSHPGNIGSSARAMKTMGLSRLVLVAPLEFPSDKALYMASGATDVVENAQVVETFDEAIAACHLVIGASARTRRIPWPVAAPDECAKLACEAAACGQKVALVFGREASGLTNEELSRCHYHLNIPSNPEYGVLNVAMAVQVVAYEIWKKYTEAEKNHVQFTMPLPECRWDVELATSQELEFFHEHLAKTLEHIGFLDPENPRQMLNRARRLFSRMQMDKLEVNMLRGILTAVQETQR